MTAPDSPPEKMSLLADVYLSIVFLTRLPAPDWPEAARKPLGSVMWAFPLVGVLVATLGGLVFALCDLFGWPPILSAVMAVAAMIIVTGGLHEDGLSDLADGVWGAATPERRLAIMSDSRIGAFGGIALILSLVGRVAAIAALGEPEFVLGGLVAAAAVSRALMPAVMAFGAPAKDKGLGADAGKPDTGVWIAGLLIAAIVVMLAAPGGWFMALVGAGAGAALIGWFAARTLGGYTGDTLGATQQVSELFALAFISAAVTQAY